MPAAFSRTTGVVPTEDVMRPPVLGDWRAEGKREKRQPSGLSAKQKRLEFVSAKRVQTTLQVVCTTIERTEKTELSTAA